MAQAGTDSTASFSDTEATDRHLAKIFRQLEDTMLDLWCMANAVEIAMDSTICNTKQQDKSTEDIRRHFSWIDKDHVVSLLSQGESDALIYLINNFRYTALQLYSEYRAGYEASAESA